MVKHHLNGREYTTYRDAAYHNGLLFDNQIWDDTLQDAKSYQNPKALRQLFAVILGFNDPFNAFKLWQKYKDHLSDDFRYVKQQELREKNIISNQHRLQCTQLMYDEALKEIQYDLMNYGKTLEDYQLPSVSFQCKIFRDQNNQYIKNKQITLELRYDIELQKKISTQLQSNFIPKR